MSIAVQSSSKIISMFSTPRAVYMDFLRQRLLSETEGQLKLIEVYDHQNTGRILVGGEFRSLSDFRYHLTVIHQRGENARSVSEVRGLLADLKLVKSTYSEEIENMWSYVALFTDVYD